jgi:hypothetical protein
MMRPVEKILDRLEGVKGSSSGWTAKCPAHDDGHASLSVGEGNDGRALLRCFAGCDIEAISAALGLAVGDLFSENGGGAATKTPRFNVSEDQVQRWHQALVSNEVALARLAQLRGWTREPLEQLQVGFDGQFVTIPYRDESVRLVGLVRYQPNPELRTAGPKTRAEAGSRRDLFPRPETSSPTDGLLLLTEGEPDALRALSIGLTAVSVPGVNGWRKEWAKRFAGRSVVVVFDCDSPGREAAGRVAGDLVATGTDVRILDLDSEREDGFDLSDFLAAARSVSECESARRLLLDMAQHVPQVAPTPEDPETRKPAPEDSPPEDLAQLLDDVTAVILDYVVLAPNQADALALWVAHSHTFEAAVATPYVNISSAEAECGKTLLLELLSLIVARKWFTSGVTAAALLRKVHRDSPTLLLDETDPAFNGNKEYAEALRGVLNSGYRLGGVHSQCVSVGRDWDVADFNTFCPKAFAGIGKKLPPTVRSRSIPIRLKRRAPGERVKRFRLRDVGEVTAPVRARLETFAAQGVDGLKDARPELPEQLGDRTADVWEPLFAIADLAGDGWPERAREAAITLAGADKADEESLGVRLLSDIRAVFGERKTTKLPSADLVSALIAIEDAPWADLHGRALTANQLARRLKEHEAIRPKEIRVGDATCRGYEIDAFQDVWSRYLPAPPAQTETPETLAQPCGIAGENEPKQEKVPFQSESPDSPLNQANVSPVSVQSPGEEGASATARKHPVPGDPEFVYFLRDRFEDGHITEAEWQARHARHQALERGPEQGSGGQGS